MKIILSIPLLILINFTGITVHFDAHYCKGKVVATKVSLSGKLATCGMEKQTPEYAGQETIENHCCEDITSAYNISNNYIPSTYNLEMPGRTISEIIPVTLSFFSGKNVVFPFSYKIIRPPGFYSPETVYSTVLCIFRF